VPAVDPVGAVEVLVPVLEPLVVLVDEPAEVPLEPVGAEDEVAPADPDEEPDDED